MLRQGSGNQLAFECRAGLLEVTDRRRMRRARGGFQRLQPAKCATDVGLAEFGAVGMQGGAFEHVAQFADVARPGVAGEQGEAIGMQPVVAGQLVEDRLAQRRQIGQAFAQGRHADRQHIDAVVEVGAKAAAGDRLFQVDGGRGDQAYIALQHLVGADRLELLLLQHAQQLALQGQRHVADLVEKQRAALGDLQLARPALARGAGEGARRGAEELGLQQAFGNRRRVDADERLVGPRRGGMDGMREQFLAGAGLAEQQHRRFHRGAAPGVPFDLQALGAGADEMGEAVLGLARAQQ